MRRFGRPRTGVALGVLMLGSLTASSAGIVGLVGDVPVWRARTALRDGARLVREGDYPLAIRTLLGVVAGRPDDARAHYYLGVAYAHLGARTAAMNQLGDAVRLAPADPLMHDGLGEVLRQVGERRAAVGEL